MKPRNVDENGTRWRLVSSLTTRLPYPGGNDLPLPIKQEVAWDPQAVWTSAKRGKSPPTARIRTPDSATCSRVTVVTTLFRQCAQVGER